MEVMLMLLVVALLTSGAVIYSLRKERNYYRHMSDVLWADNQRLIKVLEDDGNGWKAGAVALVLSLPMLSLQAQEEDRIYGPADALTMVHKDLQRFAERERPLYRYLSLYNVPAKEREGVRKIIAGHVQHLSREPDITPPALVIGSDGTLVRVNLLDYGWSAKVYDALAEEDPWYHANVINVVETKEYRNWPGGVWTDGKSYPVNSFRTQVVVRTKEIRAVDHAPWIRETPAQAQQVIDCEAWTGSKAFLLRADWFFQQTAAVENRRTNYYTFLGVKTEADFQRLIGFSGAIAKDRKTKLRESVSISGVTLEPRALSVDEAVGGLYRRTFDFGKGTAKNEKNPLRILGEDIEKGAKASEQYGVLPNKFFAHAVIDLTKKDRDVAATVPDDVALNRGSRTNDLRIHTNAGCMECHAKAGVQDLDTYARNTFIGPFDLKSFDDFDRERQRRREYITRSISEPMAEARIPFEKAVKQATGLSYKEYQKGYVDLWYESDAPKVNLTRAARDFGVDAKALSVALFAKAKETGKLDLVLAGLASGVIPRLQYEEALPLLWIEWKAYGGKR